MKPKSTVEQAIEKVSREIGIVMGCLEESFWQGDADAGFDGTRRVAKKLLDKGFSIPDTIEHLIDHWGHVCEPAIHPVSIATLVRQVAREAAKLQAPDWVQEMNARYFVAHEGGKALIGCNRFDPSLGRNVLDRFSHEDLKKLFQNDRIPIETKRGQRTETNRAHAWLDHPDCRVYRGGIVFAPGKEVPKDVYNLWQGFGIQPVKGEWTLLRDFISQSICGGDRRLSKYVFGWLARMFQKPGEPGQVALVLRGGRGTGKSTLGKFLVEITGQHGIQISHAKHLVGNFNAHLRDAVFVFANEAFYAGDKQHEAVLKNLVTDEFLTIEGKHQNAVSSKNNVHLLLASNESWVVPSGNDERRFCVIDVSDAHAQDQKYFAAIRAEAEAGGLSAMLHDLLETDLSDFDVFRVPQTAALADQKIQSLRGAEAWLFHALNSGRIAGTDWGGPRTIVGKDSAYQDFEIFSRRRNEFRPTARHEWAKVLTRILGDTISDFRPRGGEGSRPRSWDLKSLSECRTAFERFLGTEKIEWEPAEIQGSENTERCADGIFN